jgi:hypothetical protein
MRAHPTSDRRAEHAPALQSDQYDVSPGIEEVTLVSRQIPPRIAPFGSRNI